MENDFVFALDCRHFIGDRPCRIGELCRCDKYDAMGTRILIIKLGALGDVVRTACLLPTLKEQYPQSHITWVTMANGTRILAGHPMIDKLVAFDAAGILTLGQQRFELVISLDKEPAPAALCNAVACDDKRGIGLSEFGTPMPINASARPYFQLGLDDELKFRGNDKSYPQLIHEALDLPYSPRCYELPCDEVSLARAKEFFKPLVARSARAIVGLNTGSGCVFANKAPRPEQWVTIGKLLLDSGLALALLGGPEERETNEFIAAQLGPGVLDTGCDNTESQFVGIVSQCDAVIAGDTLAMHIALARRVPVVALFGPTCEQEIDLFGMGRKIITPMECGPCYLRKCDLAPNCMDRLDEQEIVNAVDELLEKADK